MPKEIFISTQTVVYGKIFSLGGKNPNIHLETEKGTLIVDCTEQQILEILQQNAMYQTLGIEILCSQNIQTGEILKSSAKLKNIFPYSQKIDPEKWDATLSAGKEVWKNIANPMEWIRKNRA